jgi:hypothetical protein
LGQLDKLIDETPAIAQNNRYGNKAFRDFYQKVEKVICDYRQQTTKINKQTKLQSNKQ